MKIYNLMFQNLLKAVTSAQPNTSSAYPRSRPSPFSLNSNGWDDIPLNDKVEEKPQLKTGHPFLSDQPPIFKQKVTGNKPQFYQSEQEDSKLAIEMNVSEEVSEKASQVLSINEFGQEQHPMIISNFRSHNPISFYRSIIVKIHQSTSELRMSYLDLVDFVQSQKSQYDRLKEQLTQQFLKFAAKYAASFGNKFDATERQSLEKQLKSKSIQCIRLNRELTECKAQLESNKAITRNSSKRIQEQKTVCYKCKAVETEMLKLKEEMKQSQQQIEKMLIENQHLQEYIFDMEQKVVGIDLEIEKRLKEKTKGIDLPPISPIRQDKELIEQLQSEISALQYKCRKFEDQALQEKDFKSKENYLTEKENYILQRENALQKRQANIKENLEKIEIIKEQNYLREHQLGIAEENLSKKISDLRKKESQLSAWQSSLAQKEVGSRGQRDNTLANQFPSNDPSFQQSIQDLNRSGESMKSFGRNPPLDDKLQGSPANIGKFDNYQGYYKVQTLNNEEDAYRNKVPHDFVRERNNYNVYDRPAHLRTEGKKFGQSAYVPKSKEHLNDIMAKKYNPQLSNYKDSRQASPYRNLNEPVKTRPNPYHQYALPKHSPNHYGQASKNSRSSVSRGKASVFSQQAAQPRGTPRNNNQLGGLGSKLERLREEIKKEIDSIK